jgi:class 3 adenylate cyclase/alpha-beta hydrolase superfamily lysophospholipase
VEQPETRYAKTADGVHIAYQLLGDGPIDLLYVPGFASHLEHAWEHPLVARYYRRLAGSCRLILIDRRGVGLSDRVPDDALPTLEVRMDDVRAVLSVVGSKRAALLGEFDGGSTCVLYAATYPDRVAALLLWCVEQGSWVPDWPEAWTPEEWEEEYAWVERAWGTDEYVRERVSAWSPGLVNDSQFVRWYAKHLRLAASPGAALAFERMEADVNVLGILTDVRVPTVVLHREDNTMYPSEEQRRFAERIPGARFVELPGSDIFPWVGDQDSIIDAVARFFQEVRDEERQFDRVLATVMFTDIVGSTQRASQMGNGAWGELLATHHQRIRGLLARYRGREVDTAGDGFLATFDGPARAIRCGVAIAQAVRSLGLEVRVGLHTGEIELEGDAVRGIAVHIGARVASLAGPGEVLVSSTVKDLVAGSGLTFEDAGEHELKGVPDRWRLYRVRE